MCWSTPNSTRETLEALEAEAVVVVLGVVTQAVMATSFEAHNLCSRCRRGTWQNSSQPRRRHSSRHPPNRHLASLDNHCCRWRRPVELEEVGPAADNSAGTVKRAALPPSGRNRHSQYQVSSWQTEHSARHRRRSRHLPTHTHCCMPKL